MSKEQLKTFLTAHIQKFGGISRDKIESLLIPMLASDITDKQKRDKVKNLLSDMRKEKVIAPDRPSRGAIWRLVMSENV